MRTTIDLDERLMKQVEAITGESSKTRAVSKALEDYVRRVRIEELLSSLGNLDLDLDDWYEFRHQER